MKYVLTIVMVMLVGGIVYALKDYVVPTTWRYKITVEIETPEGVKSGSAVREVRARKNIARFLNPDVNDVTYEVIGEAVVVDLGKRGVLFALVDWDSYEEVYNAFPFSSFDVDKQLHYYQTLKVGSKAQLTTKLPKMITFSDLNRSDTAKIVYWNEAINKQNQRDFEYRLLNNMESTFGQNVVLKGVFIEMSAERVSKNFDARFNFFRPANNFVSWQRTLKYGDPLAMDRSNFIREAK